ncbi:MAG: hypothetical protein R3176_03185 [Woeseiaceae bacterium]|nr:hypothetical protein [Woeseiaceae bacterium]
MNRLLLVFAASGLGACGDAARDEDLVEEPAEDVYESVSDEIRGPMEEAEEVETMLRERADAVGDALEDQAGQ